MPKLPVVSGKKVIKALSGIGYVFDHQTGSHIVLRNKQGNRITVPNHKELDRGTLMSILNDVNLSTEEFLELL